MQTFVLTSDKYTHCLPPFAHLFNKFWGASQPVTIVGFEKRPPKALPSNFGFWSLGKQEDFTWAGAALAFLDRLTSDDPFILLLEDYFLSAPVDQTKILLMARYIENHEGIVKIDLTDDRLKVLHTDWEKVDGVQYVKSDDNALFQMSLQAAMWRPSFMRRYLNPKENAWMTEKNGTRRIIKDRQAGEFSGVILGTNNPPVQYVNAIGGEGNMPDVWALKRFPRWMLIELENLGLMS